MDIFKKKKAAEEDLDLPPMPPDGFDNSQMAEEMPSPPPLDDDLDLPPLDDAEMNPPTPIRDDIETSQELLELPSLSEDELELPPLEEPQPMQMPKRQAMQQRQEMPKIQERYLNQPIFLRVEKFKDVIHDINNVKAAFKDAESGIELVAGTEEKISKELQRWRNSLDDMEKKLMFIDKVLFKSS